MTWDPPQLLCLVGLLVAAYTDARTGKIPNALTGAVIVLGLLWWTLQGAPLVALTGAAVAFGVHFTLYVLGVERAGDAKLFMAVGACLGWRDAMWASGWTAVAYLPIGVAVLAARGRLLPMLRHARERVAQRLGGPAPAPLEVTMLRTAPIIAVGGLIAMATSTSAP